MDSTTDHFQHGEDLNTMTAEHRSNKRKPFLFSVVGIVGHSLQFLVLTVVGLVGPRTLQVQV